VTNNPKIIIPTHWDNFRVPYSFSQKEIVEQKLFPFRDHVKQLSPETKVIFPEHLGTIVIE
jgi:L-ascorbate metabolism protein UlaG (beta-lactamase superfamily)